MCERVCSTLSVCCTLGQREYESVRDGQQPSSRRGATPAAAVPRDRALELGSEAARQGSRGGCELQSQHTGGGICEVTLHTSEEI